MRPYCDGLSPLNSVAIFNALAISRRQANAHFRENFRSHRISSFLNSVILGAAPVNLGVGCASLGPTVLYTDATNVDQADAAGHRAGVAGRLSRGPRRCIGTG